DCCLNAVAVRRAGGSEAGARSRFFDRALIGIRIARGADDTGVVPREKTYLVAAHRVFGADGWVKADFHRITTPMARNIVTRDIRHDDVVSNLNVDEQGFAIMS